MNLSGTTIALSRQLRSYRSRLDIQIATVLLLCSGVFGQQVKSDGDKAPSSFVLVPGATNIRHFDLQGGRKQLSYRVEAEYPAQSVLDIIKQKLKQRGWSPLAVDYLNPGIPSSIVRGWDYYEDHATEPRASVRVWQADWRRERELVTYRLEYRCPDDLCASTDNLHELRITLIYDPDLAKVRR
jgi:hypothetical protein